MPTTVYTNKTTANFALAIATPTYANTTVCATATT